MPATSPTKLGVAERQVRKMTTAKMKVTVRSTMSETMVHGRSMRIASARNSALVRHTRPSISAMGAAVVARGVEVPGGEEEGAVAEHLRGVEDLRHPCAAAAPQQPLRA